MCHRGGLQDVSPGWSSKCINLPKLRSFFPKVKIDFKLDVVFYTMKTKILIMCRPLIDVNRSSYNIVTVPLLCVTFSVIL